MESTRCPKCALSGGDTSGDNLKDYGDHWYCFACEYYKPKDGDKLTEVVVTEEGWTPSKGTVKALEHRGIFKDICQKYGYRTTTVNEQDIEIADYYRDGKLAGQHIRRVEDKKFGWKGSSKGVELWGQHLWKKSGGKRLIITEGEIDCLSVAQTLGGTWPVVSIPNGSSSAVKSIKDNLDFVLSYSEVVLCFDNDKPGKEAAQKVAEILPPGLCKIVSLSRKDANEYLKAGKTKELQSALWEAQLYSPDEILHVSKVLDSVHLDEDETMRVYNVPFDKLNEFLIGQRSGEISLYVSGTGSGKSTFIRELVYNHLQEKRSVGVIMLEETSKETVDELITMKLNKPVRKIKAMRILNKLRASQGKPLLFSDIIDDLTPEQYEQAKKEIEECSLFIYDHQGNKAFANLISRLEFLAVSLKVDVIVLDHITAAATGLMSNAKGSENQSFSERLIIDELMDAMRSIAVRTGVRFDVVAQLKKTDKAFEEGARITLQDLKGSGTLGSVPNVVLAMERDRQDPNPEVANRTVVRVLKDRLTGKAGVAGVLKYNYNTGRLEEVDWVIDSEGEILTNDPTAGFVEAPEAEDEPNI